MDLTFVSLTAKSEIGKDIIDKLGYKALLVATSNNHPLEGDCYVVVGKGIPAVIRKIDDEDVAFSVLQKVPEVQVEFRFTLPTDDGMTLSVEKMNMDVIAMVYPGRKQAVLNAMLSAINIMGISVTEMDAIEAAVQISVDNWTKWSAERAH